MGARRLRLAKETLAPLAAGEMRRVVAASGGYDCWTEHVDRLNDVSFEWCPPPPTLPLEACL